MYLRQFRNLRLVNLAGNPFCKEHDYKTYVLSHIKVRSHVSFPGFYCFASSLMPVTVCV